MATRGRLDRQTCVDRHRVRCGGVGRDRSTCGGLVPVLALAAGPRELAKEHLSVPIDKGADTGLKTAAQVFHLHSVPDGALGPRLSKCRSQSARDARSSCRPWPFS